MAEKEGISIEKIKEQGEEETKEQGEKKEAKEEKTSDKDLKQDIKYERVKKLARYYYKRRDVQKAIYEFSKNREVVPRYYEGFGKRPDMLQYPADIAGFAERGMTSIHCSEELWQNPLNISNEMREDEIARERIGWDLLLDIDCKFLEYSKISASLIIEALKFHSINNFSLKFTGGKGFHIFVSHLCFPESVKGVEIKDFFPQGPRAVAAYLKEFLFKPLGERILNVSNLKEIKESSNRTEKELLLNGKFNPFSLVELDTVLISPRHLFRMPYSLHEKTSLAAIPLKSEQLKLFRPDWAKPDVFFAKPIEIKGERNEAKELFVQALDFVSKNKISLEQDKKDKELKRIISYSDKEGKVSEKEFKDSNLKNASCSTYPPCINNILNGMREDGRKRALFILLNFFKTLELNSEEIEKQVYEWNKKNSKLLREGYIKSQLSWHLKQNEKVLPPNCDKDVYKDIGVCVPDALCAKIKNPINYVAKKIYFEGKMKEGKNLKRRKRQTKNLNSSIL